MKYSQKSKSKTFFQLPKLTTQNLSSGTMPIRNKRAVSQVNPQKQVSAKAYGIYRQNLQPIKQYSQSAKREIASLTKMMTLFLSLKISKKFNLNTKTTYFRVSTAAANVSGTSAELQPKQWLTVEDLFYGLMLPSGNDAATALAQNFGAFLYYERLGEKSLLENVKSLDVTQDNWNLKIYCEQFVRFMNNSAREFGMKDTTFVNPHGLDSPFRYDAHSTVNDMAILTQKLIENQHCRTIMKTKSHKAIIKITCGNGRELDLRTVIWINTNKLLEKQGYVGGKTGQTVNAGNCLSTVYENKNGKRFIIVVLGSSAKDARFLDTETLIKKYL